MAANASDAAASLPSGLVIGRISPTRISGQQTGALRDDEREGDLVGERIMPVEILVGKRIDRDGSGWAAGAPRGPLHRQLVEARYQVRVAVEIFNRHRRHDPGDIDVGGC